VPNFCRLLLCKREAVEAIRIVGIYVGTETAIREVPMCRADASLAASLGAQGKVAHMTPGGDVYFGSLNDLIRGKRLGES